jgi:hypothetical protein
MVTGERERESMVTGEREREPRDRCPYNVEGKMDVYLVLLSEDAVPRCPACEEVVPFPSLSLLLHAPTTTLPTGNLDPFT